MKAVSRKVLDALALSAFAVSTALWSGTVVAAEPMVIVVPEEPSSLDPCDTNTSATSRILRNNVTETLVSVDPNDGSIIANLATEWSQVSPTTWRFKLHSGVQFHDGQPFNAAAVANALARAQLEPLGCAIRGSKLGTNPFTSNVVDDLTIDIIGENPDPAIPYRMAILDIGSPALSNTERTRQPIGTGPYKLAGWNQGQDIEFAAFDGYWGAKPAVTDVRFVWRGESSVRAAMVDTGEASLAFAIAPQDATSPLDKTYLNSEATFIRLDTRLAPLDDIRVRRAANLAIDRDALIGTVFSKDVQKSTQLNVPSIVGHSPNIKPWPYDPEQAKKLLAEAKADGKPVDAEIVLYGRLGLYPNSTESLEAIQAMLQAVGFNVRVQMMEVKTWLEHLLKPFDDEKQANMLQSQSDNALGDSVFTIAPKFRSDGNQATIADPKLDALIDKAATLTGDERRKTYEAAYEYMASEIVPYIDLFYMVGIVRVAANVDYTPDVQANNEIKLRTITLR